MPLNSALGRAKGSSSGGGGGSTVVRLDAQFDSTTNTLATITGFSKAMAAGSKWKFRAFLFVLLDSVGLGEVAIDTSDTLSVTSLNAQVYYQRNASSTSWVGGGITTLGGHVQGTSNQQGIVTIEGSVKVNAAGTLVFQFCQSAGPNGTSSALVNSYVEFSPVT